MSPLPPLEEVVQTTERRARRVFRHLSEWPADYDDAVADSVACAIASYRSLESRPERGATAATIARYAALHVSARRGWHSSRSDALSPLCRDTRGYEVEALLEYATAAATQEDPAHIVQVKLDLSSWLSTLPPCRRAIADDLMAGMTATAVGRKYGFSSSRITRIRQELRRYWDRYIGQMVD